MRKGVQCCELFGVMALESHAFFTVTVVEVMCILTMCNFWDDRGLSPMSIITTGWNG